MGRRFHAGLRRFLARVEARLAEKDGRKELDGERAVRGGQRLDSDLREPNRSGIHLDGGWEAEAHSEEPGDLESLVIAPTCSAVLVS